MVGNNKFTHYKIQSPIQFSNNIQSIDDIIIYSVLQNPQPVSVQAVDEIVLAEGFEATEGKDFSAYINPNIVCECRPNPNLLFKKKHDSGVSCIEITKNNKTFQPNNIINSPNVFECIPNPASSNSQINYSIKEKGNVRIL